MWPSIELTPGAPRPGHFQSLATGSFYGDSFVKPFLVVRAAMCVRMPVSRGRSIWPHIPRMLQRNNSQLPRAA
jgi:hypothetical protein